MSRTSTPTQTTRQAISSANRISIPNMLPELLDTSQMRKSRHEVSRTKQQMRTRSVSVEKVESSFLDARQTWLNIEWAVFSLSNNVDLFQSIFDNQIRLDFNQVDSPLGCIFLLFFAGFFLCLEVRCQLANAERHWVITNVVHDGPSAHLQHEKKLEHHQINDAGHLASHDLDRYWKQTHNPQKGLGRKVIMKEFALGNCCDLHKQSWWNSPR